MTIFRWVVLLILLAAVGVQHKAKAGERAWSQQLEEMLATRVLSERWVGQQIPDTLGFELRSGSDWALFWLLNWSECRDCHFDLENWRAVAADSRLTAHLGVIGVTAGEAERIADALGSDTNVFYLGDQSILSVLRAQGPSFRFLVDRSGIVVSADGRTPDSQCRWSYIAQLDAQLGLGLGLPFQPEPITVSDPWGLSPHDL